MVGELLEKKRRRPVTLGVQSSMDEERKSSRPVLPPQVEEKKKNRMDR